MFPTPKMDGVWPVGGGLAGVVLKRLGLDCVGVEVVLPNKPPGFDSVLPNKPVVLVCP